MASLYTRASARKTWSEFITLVGGAAAWPLAARAQQPRRIGVLMGSNSETEPFALAMIKAFRQGLRDLGWTEDRNLQIELRWGAGDPARTQDYAAELVGLAPDLIVANTLPAVIAVARLSSTLPIVQVRRSGGFRTGRQPRQAWWQHHWILRPGARDYREMARGAQGGRSAAHSRPDPSEHGECQSESLLSLHTRSGSIRYIWNQDCFAVAAELMSSHPSNSPYEHK
jgi:hypothetical protein